MKTSKKVLLITLALIVFMSTIAAAKATRYYKIEVGESKDLSAGRAGATFIKAYYTGKVKLTRFSKNNAPGEPNFKVTQKPIDVRFRNYKGEWLHEVNNAVYVHFKLSKPEMEKWKAGKLSIYSYQRGTWKMCPTYEVWGRASGEMRVSCRIRFYGLYSVGVK